jgi:hypothetical protein
LWPIREQIEDPKHLSAPGRKIVDLVKFKGWSVSAAYNLQAALNQKVLLFPYKGDDKAVQDQYIRYHKANSISEDAIENLGRELWGVDDWEAEEFKIKQHVGVVSEINQCIDETCNIVRTVTPGGTEQFELPKMADQPEGLDIRRRDRWSALLLANYAAKVYLGTGHKPSNLPGRASGGHSRGPGTFSKSRVRRRGCTMY